MDQNRSDYKFGSFTLSFKKMRLFKDNKVLSLSTMEFRLLCYLVIHEDELVRSETLMDTVWGYESDISPGTVYTHVSWLRKKLKSTVMPSGYIQTVRNVGYIFSQQEEEMC